MPDTPGRSTGGGDLPGNGNGAYARGKLWLDRPADGVMRLTINNPVKRNALDLEILDAIAEALGDQTARCVLITGTHGMFSSGYDIGDMPDESFVAQAERLVANPGSSGIMAVEQYPFPTVAAMSGHAIGGGLELALACDLRIATTRTRLGMPPGKLGLVYSHTGLQRFIDVVGLARTNELFFSAGEIDAATAWEWGLVNAVVPDEAFAAAALDLAMRIAGNAPMSLSGNKRVIRQLLASRNRLDAEAERGLISLRAASFESRDFQEGVRAFAEKRPPKWRGR